MITVNCISLADQHDRRAHMRKQLDACGLPYRFVDAVRINLADGWPDIYEQRRRMNHAGVDLRAGEMGCYLSHRQVWRDFLAGDDEVCLVLEDDVNVHPDFAEVVGSLYEARREWEFVRLFGVFKREAFPVRHLVGGHYLVDYLKQPNGTQGYLLNRQAAQRLLDYTGSMWHAIDNAIDHDWEHGVRIMGVEPSVISDPQVFDTTLGAREKRRLSLYKKILREYHRAGHNLRKQFWLLTKRLRLRAGHPKHVALVRRLITPPFPQKIPLDLSSLRDKSIVSILWRGLRTWLILWTAGQNSLEKQSIDTAHKRLLWIYKGWPQIGDSLMDLSGRCLLRNAGVHIDLFTDSHLANLFGEDDVFDRIFSDESQVDATRYDMVIVDSYKARCLSVKTRHLPRLPFVTMRGYFAGPEFNRTLFSFFRMNQLLGNPKTDQEIEKSAVSHLIGTGVVPEVAISPDAIAFAIGGVVPERTFEGWDRVAAELIKQGKVDQIVLLGSGNGQNMATRVIGTISAISTTAEGKIVNCVDQFTLLQTFEIMKKCRFLVCCDGGLLHLANAAQLATVALFDNHVAPGMRLTAANRSIPIQSPGTINDLPAQVVIDAIEKALALFPPISQSSTAPSLLQSDRKDYTDIKVESV